MTNAEIIWNYFENKKFNPYAIAGIMGNLKAESNLLTNNLQDTANRSLKMTDEEYTKAVDNGTYTNFIEDKAGYGLAQWTWWSLKKELYDLCKERNKSISDINCQLDCLYQQIINHKILGQLNATTSVRAASDIFLTKFERPQDQSEQVQVIRANYGQSFYDQFNKQNTSSKNNNSSISNTIVLKKGDRGLAVKTLQENLIKLGYNLPKYGADGDFGNETLNAVLQFQRDYKLDVDGLVGPATQATIQKALNDMNNTKEPIITYSGVKIGSSSKDEKGQYRGGQAGDQTGKEVYILDWYDGGWHSVIRPKASTLAEKIASACEKGCNNNNIGYDQYQRNSLYVEAKKVGMDLSKITTPCECDCSSFVSICCIAAGLPESIFFAGNNMRVTQNLSKACEQTGEFNILQSTNYTKNKDYLKRGDILLSNGHTVIVLSNGNKAGQIAPTQIKTETYKVKIIANKLNVRLNPSISAPIVTQIYKNEIYTITEEREGWGKLKSGRGWISLNYTQRI